MLPDSLSCSITLCQFISKELLNSSFLALLYEMLEWYVHGYGVLQVWGETQAGSAHPFSALAFWFSMRGEGLTGVERP